MAFATAKTIEFDFIRAWAFADIAAAQAEAGDLVAALATAKMVEDADERARISSGSHAPFGRSVILFPLRRDEAPSFSGRPLRTRTDASRDHRTLAGSEERP